MDVASSNKSCHDGILSINSIEFFIRKSDDQKDITYVVTSGNQ